MSSVLTRRNFMALGLAALARPVRAETPVLTVAVVPQFDLRRIQATWGPILDRAALASGLRLQLVTEPTIPQFEAGLHQGLYDFAYMNPYHYVVASKRQGYRALLRDQDNPLYGIVVVRKNSGLTDIRQLNGGKVAFPAPNAMGAALIPRAEFSRKYHLTVRETYVKSHDSAYLNVVMGQADAAGGIKATFDQQKPEVKEALRIIHETDRYTPHPLAAHPRVSPELADRLVRAMMELAATPEGAKLITEIPVKTLGPARDTDYDGLRSLGLEAFYVEQ